MNPTMNRIFSRPAWTPSAAFLVAALVSIPAPAQTLTTLVTFDGGAGGRYPQAALLADVNGNLFGTTGNGGLYNCGTVFEIAKFSTGYSTAPTILANFDCTAARLPTSRLIADANGNLFGTTQGGADSITRIRYGSTVFEIQKTAGVYSSTPTILYTFNGGVNGTQTYGGVIADASGNLFGTAYDGGAYGRGAVFEIANNSGTYATPTILASFDGTTTGWQLFGNLLADSNGNLFGTTRLGAAGSIGGTVFEIVKSNGVYATSPTTLANFDTSLSTNPQVPESGVIADANGNLFGTTLKGGTNQSGTVFEIVNNNGVYASTPTLLFGFDGGAYGRDAQALLADANGNLFGTTKNGGAYGWGTVFKIAKTTAGYAATPTLLYSFDGGANGGNPLAGLIADANGNLFGTTAYGGAAYGGSGYGTAFEITGSGFVPFAPPYKFSGFLAPVSGPPTVNSGKAGRTYPIKWQLTNSSGAYVSALTAVKSITYSSVPCGNFTSQPSTLLDTTATGGTSLQYDPIANQYIYNWASPSQAGCYSLFLTLDSSQTFRADFTLN